MIEVVYDVDYMSFLEKVRKYLNEGYIIKGAECAKNYPNYYQPFIYTAILIKL